MKPNKLIQTDVGDLEKKHASLIVTRVLLYDTGVICNIAIRVLHNA